MQSEQQLPTTGDERQYAKFPRLGLGEPTNFGIEADSPGNVEGTADKLWELPGDQPWHHLSGVKIGKRSSPFGRPNPLGSPGRMMRRESGKVKGVGT
jgi:hypothetical protein